MKIAVKQVYTSAACNRSPEVVDWNSEGVICYGACNSVVIYDRREEENDPLTVLCHHRSQVNSVKWLHKSDGTSCTELVSCSADKTAAIWSLVQGQWKVTSSLTGHEAGVTCIHGLYNEDALLVYTASIDSNVRVWERINDATTLKQVISLHSGLCLTLHAHILPSINKPILFCALDDHKIHIFSDDDYHKAHTLVGHEDWVRGLDVMDVDDKAILLASASQDTYIRLWRIQEHTDEPTAGVRMEERVFEANNTAWSVKLEAVLAGHEGWVYGVHWHPYRYQENKRTPIYRLLSSSLDKTLIIWEPEPSVSGAKNKGAWVERVRVGEVGGYGLGFYGSRFGPDGKSFLGHGYNGSFHIWSQCEESERWDSTVVFGGHHSSVEDVRWEPHEGRYIMSVSADQTTRVHAPWKKPDGKHEWHEIARPQVHGYDMASLALVSSTTFVSAAEEKVIRVLSAPHNFITNFKNITGDELVGADSVGPQGASVPSLGLSNKAVFIGDEGKTLSAEDNDGYFVSVDLKEPPTEEILMQNTLWPEVQKLYGHGYEVYTLDASPDGALLASACKATSVEHAAVLIWETKTWHQVQKLESHPLTVTQLAFSPDSRRLLSVSRDRTWTLFLRTPGSDTFHLVAKTDKTNGLHSRIIWCSAWSRDGEVFGTGSREGKVCVWTNKGVQTKTSLGEYGLLGNALVIPNSSVTALAFAPLHLDQGRVVVTGFESGLIRIYLFDGEGWRTLHELDHSAAHHLTVRRLSFKPKIKGKGDEMLLASCGGDHFVRIHKLVIH